MGDTNSRLAPLDDKVRNITTGAIPLMFNPSNGAPLGMQLPDYPDGGFYSYKGSAIRQLTTQTLHFENGQITEDVRSAHEVQHWPEYRMIMCLDSQFLSKPVINNQTVFEYEDFLREEFENADILVRKASDCFNHKALSIGFPTNLVLNDKFNFIENYLKDDSSFQFKILSTTKSKNRCLDYHCIFAPIDKVNLLHEAVSAYLYQAKHPVLSRIQNFFKTSSWQRNALIGTALCVLILAITILVLSTTIGIGAIPALILGSALASSLSTVYTSLILTSIALGITGLFASAAVGIGFLSNTENNIADSLHKTIPIDQDIGIQPSKLPIINNPIPVTFDLDTDEDDHNKITISKNP